jgi:hypothetical protein
LAVFGYFINNNSFPGDYLKLQKVFLRRLAQEFLNLIGLFLVKEKIPAEYSCLGDTSLLSPKVACLVLNIN